jgi:hypothetical protein
MKRSPRYYVIMLITIVGTVLITDAVWNTGREISSLKYILTDFRLYIGIVLIILSCLLIPRDREKDLKH